MGLFRFLFRKLAEQVFKQVDYDNSGSLDLLEVEIAVLKMYNVVNKRTPSFQNPPKRAQIQAAFNTFDVNGNGKLDKAEFVEFARDMVHYGPDAFFARVGRNALIKGAVVPYSTHWIQKACRDRGALNGVSNAPLHVLAPVLGVLGSAVRGLIPNF